MKHLSLRIEEELLSRFHCVCQFYGRSANQQLLLSIRKTIDEYEKEYGKITAEDLKSLYRGQR